MKRWTLLAAVIAALGLMAGSEPAEATIVRQLSLTDMAKRADLIVRGHVVRRTSSWNPERTRIYTVSEIRVDAAMKGGLAPGSVVPVRQIGGQVDGVVQTIAGDAHFTEGEEVVVFLDRDETLPFSYLIGLSQGKFSVRRDAGQAVVGRNTAELALVAAGPDGTLGAPISVAAPDAPSALGMLEADIRAALQAP